MKGRAAVGVDPKGRDTLAGHEHLLLGEVPSLTMSEVA